MISLPADREVVGMEAASKVERLEAGGNLHDGVEVLIEAQSNAASLGM